VIFLSHGLRIGEVVRIIVVLALHVTRSRAPDIQLVHLLPPYPLIPFGSAQDMLLGFDPLVVSEAEPWESVKDASAGSAQAAGFTDPAAVGKGYEFPSTGSGGQASD